ncbi:MAG: AAA family ATPase, partial [Clostridium sp.]|nr:AAA family ATPase [Clostridium sp.]
MGVYLNPGNDAFAMTVRDDIYVDKTELLGHTNDRIGKRNRFICVSRPRRFGKSITAEMLAAYYGRECDSSEMFKPYKIAESEDYEKHLNQYNVIFLNVQNAFSRADTIEEVLQYIQKEILLELREVYGALIPEDERLLSVAMEKLFSKSREQFIFILDEWDCIFRIKKGDREAQDRYLDFLRDLLKDKTYVSLAYMTGILPIKKYGVHSALNMFDEYSMTNPGDYAKYIGFTEGEVKGLCEAYQADFETIRSWYDG